VADYLGTKHTEVILSETDFTNAIPEVIYTIESYDTTTVRASIGNYLLAKYIAANSHAKVIFNGDGSDEVCGGYLYMGCAPNAYEFDSECRRLVADIHKYDVLRSDKSISSNGLEPRTPFLDRSFVQYYLSIHPQKRFHTENNVCEKFLLRNAFQDGFDKPLLPSEILWRKKEAFSDGVSKTERSLFTIIQEYVETQMVDPYKWVKYISYPITNEQKYYRGLYDNYYPHTKQVVPYYWMPKWVDATDASARTLAIYNQTRNQTIDTI
jgi:asparagine synthase (glutamine-hydrolysing)